MAIIGTLSFPRAVSRVSAYKYFRKTYFSLINILIGDKLTNRNIEHKCNCDLNLSFISVFIEVWLNVKYESRKL